MSVRVSARSELRLHTWFQRFFFSTCLHKKGKGGAPVVSGGVQVCVEQRAHEAGGLRGREPGVAVEGRVLAVQRQRGLDGGVNRAGCRFEAHLKEKGH
jgi:hypothetical protein